VSPTSSTELNLSVTSIDSQSGGFQWERELRISSDGFDLIQLSHFGTDLYLHGGTTLFALNAANGATHWQREVGYSFGANTIEAGNVVYVPGSGANGRAALYALKAEDGEQIWQCTHFGFGAQFTALALYHGVLFANSEKALPHFYDSTPQFSEPANAVFALNAEDGAVYWRTTVVGE
jgi:outer membrane protein assembly factor BamB